jgi:Uma2 family endonuclease
MTARLHQTGSLQSRRGDPTWEIVEYLPLQGEWSAREYFALIDRRGIEFNNGVLEFLPMPTNSHQSVLEFIYEAFKAFVIAGKFGKSKFSGIRVKLTGGKFREPDILFVLTEHLNWIGEKYWLGADLVMEVVSPGGRKRDLVDKRVDYAAAGISEYWIVDPKMECITVLKLAGKKYVEHGVFKRGERATSVLLNGFDVDVNNVLNAN